MILGARALTGRKHYLAGSSLSENVALLRECQLEALVRLDQVASPSPEPIHQYFQLPHVDTSGIIVLWQLDDSRPYRGAISPVWPSSVSHTILCWHRLKIHKLPKRDLATGLEGLEVDSQHSTRWQQHRVRIF